MTRKQMVIVLTTLMVVLGLSGCGSDDDPGSVDPNGGKTVLFKIWVLDDSYLRYWLIGPGFTDDELPVVVVNKQVVSDGYDASFMEENGYGVFWREDIPIAHSGTIDWTLSYGGKEVSGQLEMPETPGGFTCNGIPVEQAINSDDGPFTISWSSSTSDTNDVYIRAGGQDVYSGHVENGEIVIAEATSPGGTGSLSVSANYYNGDWPNASLDEVIWTNRKGPVSGPLGTGWAYAGSSGDAYWPLGK